MECSLLLLLLLLCGFTTAVVLLETLLPPSGFTRPLFPHSTGMIAAARRVAAGTLRGALCVSALIDYTGSGAGLRTRRVGLDLGHTGATTCRRGSCG